VLFRTDAALPGFETSGNPARAPGGLAGACVSLLWRQRRSARPVGRAGVCPSAVTQLIIHLQMLPLGAHVQLKPGGPFRTRALLTRITRLDIMSRHHCLRRASATLAFDRLHCGCTTGRRARAPWASASPCVVTGMGTSPKRPRMLMSVSASRAPLVRHLGGLPPAYRIAALGACHRPHPGHPPTPFPFPLRYASPPHPLPLEEPQFHH
jgi:hypothetical protein